MHETPQQYTQRILANLQGKKPLEVLASTPRQVAALVKGVTKKAPRQASGARKMVRDRDSGAHCRRGDRAGFSSAAHSGINQDVWAQYSVYAKHDPALSLEAFRTTRERTVRLLKSLPHGMWENYRMHSERGKETVTRVTEMMAGHDINHLGQIRQILSGPARRKS